MAVYENEGLLTYKDKNGDLQRLYPMTKMKCIEGIDVVEEHIGSTSNPHKVYLAQLGVTATAEELNLLSGATLNVQDQLNSITNDIRKASNDAAAEHMSLNANINKAMIDLREEFTQTITDNSATINQSFGTKADKGRRVVITLLPDGWSPRDTGGYYQRVVAQGVTTDNAIFVAPSPDPLDAFYAYTKNMVVCAEQAYNQVTFVCMSKPTVSISVNIAIMDCTSE